MRDIRNTAEASSPKWSHPAFYSSSASFSLRSFVAISSWLRYFLFHSQRLPLNKTGWINTLRIGLYCRVYVRCHRLHKSRVLRFQWSTRINSHYIMPRMFPSENAYSFIRLRAAGQGRANSEYARRRKHLSCISIACNRIKIIYIRRIARYFMWNNSSS